MSNPLSKADLALYDKMLRCLNSIAYSATHAFQEYPEKRSEIVNEICECAVRFSQLSGCGNLCMDQVQGCIPCDKVPYYDPG